MAPSNPTSPTLPTFAPEWHENTTLSEVRVPAARLWSVDIGDASGARRRFLREGQSIEIGSSARADLRLEDRCVSARHCVVWVDGGRLRFADDGSRNGTYAGGSRVSRGEVEPGGALVMGRTVLSFGPCGDADDSAELANEPRLPGLVGDSLVMRRLAREVRQLAPLRVPVLVRGETGTGKELVARALHEEGVRRSQPFVALNMGAMPVDLADAELFGHERGAFTGAVATRQGAFDLARNGTLFLDEIAELPLGMQAKLLRALEGGEIRAIGAGTSRRVDVRIVAATWAPLENRVYEGSFREDLFHRLAVLPLYLPALRERKEDIPVLAQSFLATTELGPRVLSSGALSCLIAYGWPGNVRELRNVLFRAANASRGEQITSEHVHAGLQRGALPSSVRGLHVSAPQSLYGHTPSSVPPPPSGQLRPKQRASEIRSALLANQGNVSATAREMGISRATVRTWAK